MNDFATAVLLLVAFAAVTMANCENATNAGICIRIDAACVWCNGTANNGNYCINLTRTAHATPTACLPCSSYATVYECYAGYNSATGAACHWCGNNANDPALELYSCSAPGEFNPTCGNCTLDPLFPQCERALDASGRWCNLQCSLDVFSPTSCAPSPTTCALCSALTAEALCNSIDSLSCLWCKPGTIEGPYCTSTLLSAPGNPNCNCGIALSASQCESTAGPHGTICQWCASPSDAGPYCVGQELPRWCVEKCWNQNSAATCNPAAPGICQWCGDDLRNGYFCTTTGRSLTANCTSLCSRFHNASACTAVGCWWCNTDQAVGDFCRQQGPDCPRCSTYTTAVACESQIGSYYGCSWCNPNASTGPFCGSEPHTDCPACGYYTMKSQCIQAETVTGGCAWCDGLRSEGNYCMSLFNNTDLACPICRTYNASRECAGSYERNDVPCLWCNASASTGPYCSAGTSTCGRGCPDYGRTDCGSSFDTSGPCVWCNASDYHGHWCTSTVNSTCPSCNGYTNYSTCVASFDSKGSCQWCSEAAVGPYCTGAAIVNSNCGCDQPVVDEATCIASHDASTGAPCYYCSVRLSCVVNEGACSALSCDVFESRRTCEHHNCSWCSAHDQNSLCRSSISECPACSTYSPSFCPAAVSPPFTAASCFLCSPGQPDSHCASMVPHAEDPSMCPPCSAYTTEYTCTGSLLAMSPQIVSCKWCAVSYSCVPDTQGCGDCFSFLVPGNRLKPYWLSFVTVVKDYLVLLLAVAIAPKLKHLWRRRVVRRSRTPARDDDDAEDVHVVVYVAQDELVDGNGAVVGSLTESLAQALQHDPGMSCVADVMETHVRDEVVWGPATVEGPGTAAGVAGGWINATYVSSRHLLQRAAYAAVLPPNVAVMFMGVVCAVAFVVTVGVETASAFAMRRKLDSDLFGWNMYFVVLGYRVVNSGLQPTAALTLWQALVTMGVAVRRRLRRDPGSAAEAASITSMLRTWTVWTRYVAAVQLVLFAPVWCVSFIGIGSYIWVFVPTAMLGALVAWVLRQVADMACDTGPSAVLSTTAFAENLSRRHFSLADAPSDRCLQTTSIQDADGHDRLEASSSPPPDSASTSIIHTSNSNDIMAAAEVDAATHSRDSVDAPLLYASTDDDDELSAAAVDGAAPKAVVVRWWSRTFDLERCLSEVPNLPRGRRVVAVMLLFLCQRAIPVLVLSTALQTGYNYAALYVLAPGHMYSGYLDVVPLEYGARSNVCLIDDVENIMGDAAASVTSYLMPFA